VRESIISTFIALSVNEAGQAMLDAVQIPAPVRAEHQRDYAPLEALGLEKFVVHQPD
jgi:phosphonate transport system substrate-binding protein